MSLQTAETVGLFVLLFWQLLSSAFIFWLVARGWMHLGHTSLVSVNLLVHCFLSAIFRLTYYIYLNINPVWLAGGATCNLVLALGEFSDALLPPTLMFLTGDTMRLARNPLNYITKMTNFHLFDKVVSPLLLAALITMSVVLGTVDLGLDGTSRCVAKPKDLFVGYKPARGLALYCIPFLFISGFTCTMIYYVRLALSSKPRLQNGERVDENWVVAHCTPVWFLVGMWTIMASVSTADAFMSLTQQDNNSTLEEVSSWSGRLFTALLPAWWLLGLPDARLLAQLRTRAEPKSVSASLVTITSTL